jgi:hypothetical protein
VESGWGDDGNLTTTAAIHHALCGVPCAARACQWPLRPFSGRTVFIVCGNRPDRGYVDQPTLIPLLASWSHALFGDFLWGFRLLPMPTAAATVAGAAESARALGAGRFAQYLSGLCVLLAPVFLLEGALFSTDKVSAFGLAGAGLDTGAP